MSDAKVVPFSPNGVVPAIVLEPDAELIKKLENILADARSGHLRALAFVMIDRDRSVGTGWLGHADNHDMVAGVNRLAFRYMSAGMEDEK